MGRTGPFVIAAAVLIALILLNPAFPSATTRKLVNFDRMPTEPELAEIGSEFGTIERVISFPRSNLTIVVVSAIGNSSERPAIRSFRSGRSYQVSDDTIVSALLDISAGLVRAPQAWNTYNLTGTNSSVIAILDTGLDANHPDVNSTRLALWNDTIAGQASPYDNHTEAGQIVGHGTHVAGIAAGSGAANSSLKGVAPSSGLAAVKVLDDTGHGSSSAISASLAWLAGIAPGKNITVASMSLGGPLSAAFDAATNSLAESGVVVVCAAGNNGPSGALGSPANASKCITVVALTDSNRLTSYSSIGSDSRYPDIAAPGGSSLAGAGYKVNSSMSNSTGNATAYYHELAGTSMAAPFVAGAAQLVIQALAQAGEPWNYSEPQALKVKMLLLMTATETNQTREFGGNSPTLGRGAPDKYEGYGKLNLDAAIEAVLENATEDNSPLTMGFDNSSSGKRAAARRISVPADKTVTEFLSVPAGMDADLYFYSSSPDSVGKPVILQNSTTAAFGGNESFSIAGPASGYLVTKFVSGASGNLTLTAVAGNVTDYSLPAASHPRERIWLLLRTYNGTGSPANGSVQLSGSCIDSSSVSQSNLSEGFYNLSANISDALASDCTLFANGTVGGLAFSTEPLHSAISLSSVSPVSRQANLGSERNFTISTIVSENVSVSASAGSLANLSLGSFLLTRACSANGTEDLLLTVSHPGFAQEELSAALSCFDPLGYSTQHNQTVWLNENLTAALNITNVGAENLTNLSCSIAAADENFFNSTNYTLAIGDLLQLQAEWNATNSTEGNYSVLFSCAYPNYSSNRTSSFQMEEFFATNLTISGNTTAAFFKGGNYTAGAWQTHLPPNFTISADYLYGNFTLSSLANLSGSGDEWLLISPASAQPNGTILLAAYSVNSSLIPLSSYSLNFSVTAGDGCALCPADSCLANFTEVNCSGISGQQFSWTYVSFLRDNISISNTTSPSSAPSLSAILVSGTVNNSSGGVPGTVWGSLEGGHNSTAAALNGSFSLVLTAPLAGSWTIRLNASYGASNNGTAELPISVTAVCGNGFCEGSESCCGDCGGCGGGSGSVGIFYVPPPANSTANITQPESAAENPPAFEMQAGAPISNPLPGSGIESLALRRSSGTVRFGRATAADAPGARVFSAFWINNSGGGSPAVELEFSVPNSFVKEMDSVVLVRRGPAGWEDLPTIRTGGNSTHNIYRSDFEGFSLFAILVREMPPVPEFIAASPVGFVEASSSTLGAYDDRPVPLPAAELLSRSLFLVSLVLSAAALFVGIVCATKK